MVGSSVLEKGGKCSIHFSGDSSDAELLFRTVNSTHQLDIFGAVADWCDDFFLAEQILDQSFSSVEKSIATVNEQLYGNLAPKEANTLITALEIDAQAARFRLRDHQEKLDNLSKEKKVSQTCEVAGFMSGVSLGHCYRTFHDVGSAHAGSTH